MSAWTKVKPTEPGIYQIRGFNYGQPKRKQRVAVVVVERSTVTADNGALVVNLHEKNTEYNQYDWYLVSVLDEKFEWLGPYEVRP